MRRWAAALAFVSALSTAALAQGEGTRLEEAWRRGNEAYLRGDYAGAVAAYEQLQHQGVASADLEFNLGDAYFRKGAIGPAIWAFERALALDPGDEDARYNVEQARKLATARAHDKIEGEDREPVWIRIVTALGPSTETWLFVALYLGFFGALALALRAPAEARPVRGRRCGRAGGGGSPGGGVAYSVALQLEKVPFGIVLPDALAVKEGADLNYRTSFDVHAGLRVRIVEQDGDWVRIRLANGLEGWVRGPDVGRL